MIKSITTFNFVEPEDNNGAGAVVLNDPTKTMTALYAGREWIIRKRFIRGRFKLCQIKTGGVAIKELYLQEARRPEGPWRKCKERKVVA